MAAQAATLDTAQRPTKQVAIPTTTPTAHNAPPTRQGLKPATVHSTVTGGGTDGNVFLGHTVGDCHLVALLAEGGTSCIYRAFNLKFGMDRVLKVLTPALRGNAVYASQFAQEAWLTAHMDHRSIPHVLRHGYP